MRLRSHIDRTNQNRVVKMDTAGEWTGRRMVADTKSQPRKAGLLCRPNTPNLESPVPGGVTGNPGFFGQSDELN